VILDNLSTHKPSVTCGWRAIPTYIHYTPTHTSWLNQIERWFSILVRKLLRRSSFSSLEDLRARILAFIDYFNRTMAKPIRWLYSVEPRPATGTG